MWFELVKNPLPVAFNLNGFSFRGINATSFKGLTPHSPRMRYTSLQI